MSIISEALEKAQKTGQKVMPLSLKNLQEQKTMPSSLLKRVMAVVLVLSIVPLSYFLWQGMKKAAPVPPPIEEIGEIEEIEEEEFSLPAVPLPVSDADVDRAIRLTGIMYSAEKPLAVINDSLWSEGEYVEEFEILEIERDFLKVGSGGREFTIRLKR